MTETPRVDALIESNGEISVGQFQPGLISLARKLEAELIATQKENARICDTHKVLMAEADKRLYIAEQALALRGEPVALQERIAQLSAHRSCNNEEHDPLHGKLSGYCVVCGLPWPCETAKPLYAAPISGERAMPCEDCNGEGWVGEAQYQSEFQPPERERCQSCDGSGKWPAVSGERVREALETAWLIESLETSPRYWTGSGFEYGADKAVRFVRKEDADAVLTRTRITADTYFRAEAREHMWPLPLAAQPEGKQCIYEARSRTGINSAADGVQDAWCRRHGFDCPNALTERKA